MKPAIMHLLKMKKKIQNQTILSRRYYVVINVNEEPCVCEDKCPPPINGINGINGINKCSFLV